MKRDDEGTWRTTISLGPGDHAYKLIIDGDPVPDPDVEEQVPDGKGGFATPLRILPRTEGDVIIVFSLERPDLEDVRVTGSFIDWDPEGIKMLRKEGDVWSAVIPISPGNYLYKFYIDGKWGPDPDVKKKAPDGMGGFATPLIVKSKVKDSVGIKFLLHRPEADDVRVTGTFTGWDDEGIRMAKDEKGTWSTMAYLAPGRHLYRFYIDGKWVPDPDVDEHVPDGMGGYATEFTVKAPKKTMKFETKEKVCCKPGTDFSPTIDYTRVDGIVFGLMVTNESNTFPLPQFLLEGAYSKKRSRWMYGFGVEQPLIAPFLLSVGGSIYDKTDTYDKEIISDEENFLAASFAKKEYRDYFDRRGATGFVALRPMSGHTLKLAYISDEYRPLRKRTDTALFRKNSDFAPNPINSYQICYDPELGVTLCSKIILKSIQASYELDLRDCEKTPSVGFLVRLIGEWAGGDIGGDLEYDLYSADFRHYKRISTKQKLALRLKAGMMDVAECQCPGIPGPQYFFPKTFYVGGIGTLPGYDFKEFQGTHMLLANVEYTYFLKNKLGVVFFSDGGDSRGQGEESEDVWDQMKLKFDAGIGLRYEDPGDHIFTITVAQPLDDRDRPVNLTVRASRMF
jgi:hypothetical protein